MNSLIPAILGKVCANAGKMVRAFAVVSGILLLGLPLFAQVNLGRISGRVTDQTGGVIPGARVTVTNVGTGVVRSLITDQAGQYNAPALTPGTYAVSVSATGFRTLVRKGILLETGKDVLVDVQLTPGQVTQTVEVTATPPLINTTNATLGGTLSNQTINNLPLNGRNYLNLVGLRPGMQQFPGGGNWTVSSNGLRVDSQNWIVDGMDNNESFGGLELIDQNAPVGDAATILPIDAISEFNVMENPKAEYGFSTGAIVNVGIKSGTNEVHGTAYAFGRTSSFDARNYFNAGPKNHLGLEQWGGTVGGPVIKNKLFYFAGFEEQRYNLGVPLPMVLPTNLPGSPTVSIPAAEHALASQPTPIPISNLSLKLLPLFGTSPNANGHVTTHNLTSTNLSNNVLGKLDYTLNSHNTLSAFYFWGNDSEIGEDFPVTQPEFLSKFFQGVQTFVGRWTWFPNTRWVNDLRFGYDSFDKTAGSVDRNVPATSYGINTGVTDPSLGGLPLIFVSGLGGGQSIGSGIGGYNIWPETVGRDPTYDFADDVSYLHGNHTFKWGVEVRIGPVYLNQQAFGKGNIQFTGGGAFPGSTGLEDFLAGAPAFGLLTTGYTDRNFHEYYYAIYGQDDWRVTPKLTLNLGLRWSYASPWHELNNLMGSWTPTQGLISAGGSQGSSVYNTSTKDFAPRFGLAWDIFGNGKTVLRGGSGVYYDWLPNATFMANQPNLQNFPTAGLANDPTGAYFVNPTTGAATQTNPNGITSATLFYPFLNWSSAGPVFPIHPVACGNGSTPISSGPASLLFIPAQPCNIFAVAKNFETPYVVDWTLGIEQAITNRLSLNVAYVGNHGANLTSLIDANQINPASPAEVACGHCEANADRPYGTQYPYLGIINMLGNAYISNYNGLQVTLSARNFHRMTFILGYTYSHALDDLNFSHFPTTPQNSTDLAAQYASSAIDVRHRATLSWTYDVPGINSPAQILRGWVLNSIVTLQSPMPWESFDTSNDISRTGENMDRWDFFGNPSTFSGHGYTSVPYCSGANFSNASTISCSQTVYGNSVTLSSQQSASNAAACLAAAGMVPNGPGGALDPNGNPVPDTGLTSLNEYGCFVEGSSVLVPPAIASFGFTGRNIFRDSGFYNMDFSIFKDFRFKERLTAEFRAEFFNILNHPNFANPFGGVGAWGPKFSSDPSAPANFGCGCRTPDVAQGDPLLGGGSARDIQLGLKFIF